MPEKKKSDIQKIIKVYQEKMLLEDRTESQKTSKMNKGPILRHMIPQAAFLETINKD